MLKHKHNKILSFKSAASPTMKFVLWLLSGQFSLQFFSSTLGLVVSPSVSPRGQQQERKEALHSSPTAAVYHLPVFLCFGNFHGCISGQNRQSGPQIAAVPAKARRHPSHDGRTAGQNKGRSRKAGELRQQGAAWSCAGGRPRREAGPERKSCSGWRRDGLCVRCWARCEGGFLGRQRWCDCRAHAAVPAEPCAACPAAAGTVGSERCREASEHPLKGMTWYCDF